jgi:hypothetical protein
MDVRVHVLHNANEKYTGIDPTQCRCVSILTRTARPTLAHALKKQVPIRFKTHSLSLSYRAHFHMHASLRLCLFQDALDKTHDAEQLLVHQRLAHELDVRGRALDGLGIVCMPLLGSWSFGRGGKGEKKRVNGQEQGRTGRLVGSVVFEEGGIQFLVGDSKGKDASRILSAFSSARCSSTLSFSPTTHRGLTSSRLATTVHCGMR